MSPPRASRTYWVCQGLGWSLYALLNALAVGSLTGAPGRAAGLAVAFSAMAMGLTHLLRQRVAHGWKRLAPSALAPRMVAASILLSGVVNATGMLGGYLLRPDAPHAAPGALLVYVFNWSVVFLGWQLLYFGVHFVQRTRRAELESLRLEAAANAAELRHLKAQLNPHFLFNSLNVLRALISEDPGRAQQAVTQLANLLRYALSAEGETVNLERELQVVRDYLALESLRLEERLRVRLEVEPACLPAPIPPMLVQLLVENGIKHGIARLTEGGELSIVARCRDGLLLLEVGNPRPARDDGRSSGSRVGLANASERLRLLFGERAKLELDLSLPDRAAARIQIPWPS
ncbi:histidine kinase [Archangium gephyra]|uniref:Autolysin sensor kinase n=1 Tax=Archangium gephyra TaxID=48 RepID=A0AAC8QG46_9BACT|nr:histidine kinase [Archangium gephyra]AKJ06501.1 Autolysin sensor kinase [Archangium gephyra]REG32186.1 histidine kinase [Archangium gephyra]